ncbi:hypothetical protein ACJ41O_008462 [Fusarium nematophilum]
MATHHTVQHAAEQLGELKSRYCGRNGTTGQVAHYIPRFEPEEFWRSHNIQAILRNQGVPLICHPDTITKHFLGIFSLLVYTEQVPYLEKFVENNVLDSSFPLQVQPPSWSDTPSNHKLFNALKESQWIFFPVTFDQNGLYNQVLSPQHILPISNEEPIREGDAVQVYKIEVYMGSRSTTLVRKTYHESERIHYDREFKTFQHLLSHPSRHIINYYGCYRQQMSDNTTTYNLILGYVDGGNFEEFLSNMLPPQSPIDVVRFWSAFIGVLEGLHHLHLTETDLSGQTYQGIHQDIKPENLLVSVAALGRVYEIMLVITDFGYCHTKVMKDDQDTLGIDSHGGQTYGAPESSHHAKFTQTGRQRITTLADIWSLGCVMSDAACWLVSGEEGRRRYRERRAEETGSLASLNEAGHEGCFHDGTQALKAVSHMHDSIRRTAPPNTITAQVVDMIQKHMLVPEQHRLKATQLRDMLFNITQAAYPGNGSQGSGELSSRSTAQVRRESVLSNPQEHLSRDSSRNTVLADPSTPLQNSPSIIESPVSLPAIAPPFGSLPGTGIPTEVYRTPSSVRQSVARRHSRSPPMLTFDQAKEYRIAKKAKGRVDSRVEGVLSLLKTNLSDRDHIFFIDVSETMKEHLDEVHDKFTSLSYLAKQVDTDGIEISFSSDASKTCKKKETTKLLKLLDKQSWNHLNFEHSLSNFIDKVVLPRLEPLERGFLGMKPPETKPLGILVLTDGRWGEGHPGAAGMERPMQRLIDAIKKKKLSRTQVAFQFLRFGDDRDGIRYLSFLDNLGRKDDCDFIDTKPIDGNIFEMFMGAINPDIDTADEPPQASTLGTWPLSPGERSSVGMAPF